MLVFLRHGNVDSNGKIISIDLNHSISGKEQISKAACFLKNHKPFYALYTSPSRIAVQTSEILGIALDVPVTITNELREIDCKNTLSDREYSKYVFSKSTSQLEKFMTMAEESNIIIVGHCLFFSTWICHILHNNPFDAWIRSVIGYKHPLYIVDKCSINTVYGSKGRYKFGLFNYIDYESDVKKKMSVY